MPSLTIESYSPYSFWLPPEQRCIKVGPEQHEVYLPLVPLPIKSDQKNEPVDPGDHVIGDSVYEYLRHYPDCQYNREYAELLRDAYPHTIADLASQAVMLSHKDVAAPYQQRLINYLKILLLLNPGNPGLQQQIGLTYYSLAMNFEALTDCRKHLLSAQLSLQGSIRDTEPDPATLNYLAQIAYLFGDFRGATEYWQQILLRSSDPSLVTQINARLGMLEEARVSPMPLVAELEQVGEAMQLYAAKDLPQAKFILEQIEERGNLCRDFPLAGFHYLLGMCRMKTDEPAAAFASFDMALQIDPGYVLALEASETLLSQGG